MTDIAYTPLGRNALVTGLIGHAAALLAGMMPASGGERFFGLVFPLACLALLLGGYAELRRGGRRPWRDGRLYGIAAATAIPVLGPFVVLGLLFGFQSRTQGERIGPLGLFPALARLRANGLVLFLWIVFLVLLFAFTGSRDDPYFKRHRDRAVGNALQSHSDIGRYGLSGQTPQPVGPDGDACRPSA
ncbi:MAG TPA: hypothetical protein PKH03_04100 [Syntrophales bacterium]|nr:hypothetical protein [Syntrophales bacterium]